MARAWILERAGLFARWTRFLFSGWSPLIGEDYLNSNRTGPLSVDQLLAEISGMNRSRLAGAEAGLASRVRQDVSGRIATELDSGEVVQLHGYFVAPTFGRLCAAIVLVLQG